MEIGVVYAILGAAIATALAGAGSAIGVAIAAKAGNRLSQKNQIYLVVF